MATKRSAKVLDNMIFLSLLLFPLWIRPPNLRGDDSAKPDLKQVLHEIIPVGPANSADLNNARLATSGASTSESAPSLRDIAEAQLTLGLDPDQDPLVSWKGPKWHLLVIASSKYPLGAGETEGHDVPFVSESATLAEAAFKKLGFVEDNNDGKVALDLSSSKLATLLRSYSLSKTDNLLVYYTGHGIKKPFGSTIDVFLPSSGDAVDSPATIASSTLLTELKGNPENDTGRLDGQPFGLLLVLDVCHSGAAARSPVATFLEAGNVHLLMATKTDQESLQLNPLDPKSPTAFSYYLNRALTTDWLEASQQSGVMTLGKLTKYINDRLEESVPGQMTSSYEPEQELVIGYRHDRRNNFLSRDRALFGVINIPKTRHSEIQYVEIVTPNGRPLQPTTFAAGVSKIVLPRTTSDLRPWKVRFYNRSGKLLDEVMLEPDLPDTQIVDGHIPGQTTGLQKVSFVGKAPFLKFTVAIEIDVDSTASLKTDAPGS